MHGMNCQGGDILALIAAGFATLRHLTITDRSSKSR